MSNVVNMTIARATNLARQRTVEEGHKSEVEESESEKLVEKVYFDGDLEQDEEISKYQNGEGYI